jgi:hypothetical protein
MCTWWYVNLGAELLGNVRSSCQLGKRSNSPRSCKDSWLVIKKHKFCLAFLQADLEVPVYMESPIGFDAPDNES